MRALIAILILTGLAAADPPELVPSYTFQRPRALTSSPHSHYRQPDHFTPSYQALQPRLPVQPQRGVPASLANWGGTVVLATSPGFCSITTNGIIPVGSVVGIGRGDHFLGQAQVTSAGLGSAQLTTLEPVSLAPGDWVNVLSIPAPPPPPLYAASPYRSTQQYSSTNADPTYQRWLRQGFTMGGIHRGRIYHSTGFSRSYR